MGKMNKYVNSGGGRADYLSLPNTNCVKGLFAVFVLIHHLYQRSGLFQNSYLGVIFQGMGYLSVAMFFFLSGYGLRISHHSKGNAYVNALPKKRMLPLYLQSLVLIVLYAVLYIFVGKEFEISEILQSILWGNTIIANGWYLQVILVLYALYYIVYGVIGRKTQDRSGLHVIMLVALVLYVLLNILLEKAITWYQSIFVFMFGILWCDCKERFDRAIRKHWFMSVASTFAAFSVLFIVGLKIKHFNILTTSAFVVFAVILLIRIPVNCALTRWLGRYSFEIYVMQGVGMLLFHSDLIYIENKWLYVLICTGTTLLLAIIIHPVFNIIDGIIKGKNTKQSV